MQVDVDLHTEVRIHSRWSGARIDPPFKRVGGMRPALMMPRRTPSGGSLTAAPSRDGLLAWTALPEGSDAEQGGRSSEELRELITGMRNDQLYSDPATEVPECANRRCRCVFHRPEDS